MNVNKETIFTLLIDDQLFLKDKHFLAYFLRKRKHTTRIHL